MLNQDEKAILAAIMPAEIERIGVAASKIPSYPFPSGCEQQIAELFAGELRAVGVTAELQEVKPRRPNVIARLRGRGTGRSLLFNGHIDTSPPVIGWTRDPYGGVRENDRLYGHGISNMKASDVAMVGALGALRRSGIELDGDVVLSLVMGECNGGEGTKHMLSRGVQADFFINGEPTDLQVLTLHAGVCRMQLVVTGRSHHFGISGKGVNAIEKMTQVLSVLGESLTPIGPQGWLRKRVDRPEYEGFPRFNLGAIRGGLTRECLDWGPYNTPDCCIATLDVRYPPGLSPALIQSDLERTIEKITEKDPSVVAKVELMPEFHMPPFEASPGDFPVSVVASASEALIGKPPVTGAIAPLKFMGADAGFLQEAGMPGVMCGVGTFTSSVPDEYIEVSKLIKLTEIYAIAAYRVTSEQQKPL